MAALNTNNKEVTPL